MKNYIINYFKNDKVIGSYTLKDLRDISNITLTLPIDSNIISNLKYINNHTQLSLIQNKNNIYDEEEYFKNVITFLGELAKINRKFSVSINVNNREMFRQSKILKLIPRNVNLSINYDDSLYDLISYRKEEQKLEAMIGPIRGANLSPFEKFLAVYDIVKKFKKYNDNLERPSEAYRMKYILDDKNEYIVCAGFARLLTELLNRVNIPSKYISLGVDLSYDNSTEMEVKKLNHDKHVRNLIKIDDDKYNIHGYYLADSTWDNNLQHDLYLNAAITFDRKKEARRLEHLEDEDLLLDFHNDDEFMEKIRFFIKKRCSQPNISDLLEEESKKIAYKDIYLKIMDILKYTDRKQYEIFYNKYEHLLNIYTNDTTSASLEPIVASLLSDYKKYIMPLSNKAIPQKAFVEALITIKRDIYYMSDENIKKWLMQVKKDNQGYGEYSFPYIYDKDNHTEAYLQSREKNNHK